MSTTKEDIILDSLIMNLRFQFGISQGDYDDVLDFVNDHCVLLDLCSEYAVVTSRVSEFYQLLNCIEIHFTKQNDDRLEYIKWEKEKLLKELEEFENESNSCRTNH